MVGFGTWLLVLPWLTEPRAVLPGRRAFLLRTGAMATGSLLVIGLSGWWARGRRRVEQARALLRLPVTPGRAPHGADLEVEGVPPWRTPNDAFYLIHTALARPTVVPTEWKLRIHGMVDEPLTLSYADLATRKLTESWITLTCVSNTVGGSLVGNAHWSGVLVRDLLAEAGVNPDADAVKSTSHDGWTCGTPLSTLTDPDRNAMLALAMNGEPLPLEHGFPMRLVVPGLYGFVSATKWLVDIEVTRSTGSVPSGPGRAGPSRPRSRPSRG